MKIAFLLCSALALPILSESHDTSVNIVESDRRQHNAEFLVQVTRHDDLVEDCELKATRTQSVLFAVKLEDGQVLVNNQPVEMGVSIVQLEASTMVGAADDSSIEEVMQNFDNGIVNVQIDVKGQTIKKDGTIVRQIQFSERIISLNGEAVEQEEETQILLEAFLDTDTLENEEEFQDVEMSESCIFNSEFVSLLVPRILILLFALIAYNVWLRWMYPNRKVEESFPKENSDEKLPLYSSPELPPYVDQK
jgi:hypothetical protein